MSKKRRTATERTSLTYMAGWADALLWAIENPHQLGQLTFERDARPDTMTPPLMMSIVSQASALFDFFNSDPDRWMKAVPIMRDVIVSLTLDDDHYSSRLSSMTNEDLVKAETAFVEATLRPYLRQKGDTP